MPAPRAGPSPLLVLAPLPTGWWRWKMSDSPAALMAYLKNLPPPDALRQLAQQRFFERVRHAATPMSIAELEHLVEELQIHQIELELQNEHLEATRAQLEAALTQSSELYDFSPVGSLLLDHTGSISKMNLAAASLLGGERARLLGRRLGLYISDAQRLMLNALLEQARACGDVHGGEIALLREGLPTLQVQLKVAALPNAAGWQVILLDITESKLLEERLRAGDERWKLALEAAGDGVWDWNVQTGDVVYSRRFEQLYGFGKNEYGQRLEDWSARIHPADKPQLMAALQACLSGQTDSYSNEHRGQCKDGNWKWILARGAIVNRSEDGKPLRMVGTHVDVTCRKLIEEVLRVAAQFQQAVFDSLADQVAVLDRRGTVVQTNAAWRQYALASGWADAASGVGSNYLKILDGISGHDQKTVAAVAAGIASVAGGEAVQFQLQQPFFSPADQRWFIIRATPVHDVQQRMVVSHDDVTNLKAAELASWTLANIDALTGALSRRNFLNLAEQELARSRRYELPLMLLMLDLDHFKCINDQYGHAAGDAVLHGFVQTVSAVLRESDFIGRLGGEEFAVLLPNTTLEGGQALAQRIIESVRASQVEEAGACICYTVSIGAACLASETAFATLLGRADAALYRAKDGGRDRLELGYSMQPV